MAQAVPVLVITDIGKDIDDTLALIYLSALVRAGRVALVGVVTTGGQNTKRKACVEWLLRLLLPECRVEVCAGVDLPLSPEHHQSWREAEVVAPLGMGQVPPGPYPIADHDAAAFILRAAQLWEGELRILAIGPLTDVAVALSLLDGTRILRGLGGLVIQGQAVVPGRGGPCDTAACTSGPLDAAGPAALLPDSDAYNIRCDPTAAALVFERLSDAVPFLLLGKHAAYRVQLGSADFAALDAACHHAIGLTPQVLRGLTHLATVSVPTFERVFGVDAGAARRMAPAELAAAVPFLSTPYDVLACVLLCPELARTFFEAEAVGAHCLVGNTAAEPGVRDAGALHEHIMQSMRTALEVVRPPRTPALCWPPCPSALAVALAVGALAVYMARRRQL